MMDERENDVYAGLRENPLRRLPIHSRHCVQPLNQSGERGEASATWLISTRG